VGLLRFELKSITPEATRIPSYPTGPEISHHYSKGLLLDFLLFFHLSVCSKVSTI
jgi:hypothetical protein